MPTRPVWRGGAGARSSPGIRSERGTTTRHDATVTLRAAFRAQGQTLDLRTPVAEAIERRGQLHGTIAQQLHLPPRAQHGVDEAGTLAQLLVVHRRAERCGGAAGDRDNEQRVGGGDAGGGREVAPALAELATQQGTVGDETHARGDPCCGEGRYVTKKSLRRGDACETTLNLGFKWERMAAIGLPARGGLALPATITPPVSLLRDKANVAHAVAHGRGRGQYRHEEVGGKRHRSVGDTGIQAFRCATRATHPAWHWRRRPA